MVSGSLRQKNPRPYDGALNGDDEGGQQLTQEEQFLLDKKKFAEQMKAELMGGGSKKTQQQVKKAEVNINQEEYDEEGYDDEDDESFDSQIQVGEAQIAVGMNDFKGDDQREILKDTGTASNNEEMNEDNEAQVIEIGKGQPGGSGGNTSTQADQNVDNSANSMKENNNPILVRSSSANSAE